MKKGQTRIDGMDEKIIGLYASGLTVRDIQAHLLDLYGLKVSPSLIDVLKSSAIKLSIFAAFNVFSRLLLLSGIGIKSPPIMGFEE